MKGQTLYLTAMKWEFRMVIDSECMFFLGWTCSTLITALLHSVAGAFWRQFCTFLEFLYVVWTHSMGCLSLPFNNPNWHPTHTSQVKSTITMLKQHFTKHYPKFSLLKWIIGKTKIIKDWWCFTVVIYTTDNRQFRLDCIFFCAAHVCENIPCAGYHFHSFNKIAPFPDNSYYAERTYYQTL